MRVHTFRGADGVGHTHLVGRMRATALGTYISLALVIDMRQQAPGIGIRFACLYDHSHQEQVLTVAMVCCEVDG